MDGIVLWGAGNPSWIGKCVGTDYSTKNIKISYKLELPLPYHQKI